MLNYKVLVKRVIAVVVCCLLLPLVSIFNTNVSKEVGKGAGIDAQVTNIEEMGDLLVFCSQKNNQTSKSSIYSFDEFDANSSSYAINYNSDSNSSMYNALSRAKKRYSSFSFNEISTANISNGYSYSYKDNRISSSSSQTLYRKYTMSFAENKTYYHSYLTLNSTSESTNNGESHTSKVSVMIDMAIYIEGSSLFVKVDDCLFAGGNSDAKVDKSYSQIQSALLELKGKWTNMTNVDLLFDLVSNIDKSNRDIFEDFKDLFDAHEKGEKVFVENGQTFTVVPTESRSIFGVPSSVKDNDLELALVFDLSNTETPKFDLSMSYGYDTENKGQDYNDYSYRIAESMNLKSRDSAVFSNINNTIISVDVSKASSGVEWFNHWNEILK